MALGKLITLITYDCPHRKTYDVLSRLRAIGYRNVAVLAMSMIYRKVYRPLILHRPPICCSCDTKTLCKNFGYSYHFFQNDAEFGQYIEQNKVSLFLIINAKLIHDDLLDKAIFVNSHPGYSPYTRGLDAFKWGILKNLPIGVTSYILKKGCALDVGVLIQRKQILPEKFDTFHSLAYKIYEREIQGLVDSIEKVPEALLRNEIISANPQYPPTRRMPNELEKTIDLSLKSYHCPLEE